jgi:hypothetical protein
LGLVQEARQVQLSRLNGPWEMDTGLTVCSAAPLGSLGVPINIYRFERIQDHASIKEMNVQAAGPVNLCDPSSLRPVRLSLFINKL